MDLSRKTVDNLRSKKQNSKSICRWVQLPLPLTLVDQKRVAVAGAIEKINRKFGAGAVNFAGQARPEKKKNGRS